MKLGGGAAQLIHCLSKLRSDKIRDYYNVHIVGKKLLDMALQGAPLHDVSGDNITLSVGNIWGCSIDMRDSLHVSNIYACDIFAHQDLESYEDCRSKKHCTHKNEKTVVIVSATFDIGNLKYPKVFLSVSPALTFGDHN